MTDLLDVPELEDRAPGRSSRLGWTRRRKAWLVLGLVALTAGVAVWVFVPGLVAVGQTQVLLDAKPFTCARASDAVTWADADLVDRDERVYVPAIRLHPGLDCTLEVVVRNDSDADIDVDSVSIPMAGPSNGWGVHADRSFQQVSLPSGGKDALDATFDFVHGPAAGGSYGMTAHSVQRFRFHLSWSDGCMDPGSAAILNDAPTAVISAGPWHLAKSWSGAGYAFLGGKDTVAASCGR